MVTASEKKPTIAGISEQLRLSVRKVGRYGICRLRTGGQRTSTGAQVRGDLEDRKLGSSSIIIRMSAIRKLAAEAADNGLLAPELATGIARVKSAKTQGIRTGNWLSLRQAQALLSAPDTTTTKGLRDRAIIAVLLGCGLRRSEVAALNFAHIQQRDGRWCVVDLVGKHGGVRTAPMPNWVKLAIDAWTCMAACPHAEAAGVPGIAPHDLRRT